MSVTLDGIIEDTQEKPQFGFIEISPALCAKNFDRTRIENREGDFVYEGFKATVSQTRVEMNSQKDTREFTPPTRIYWSPGTNDGTIQALNLMQSVYGNNKEFHPRIFAVHDQFVCDFAEYPTPIPLDNLIPTDSQQETPLSSVRTLSGIQNTGARVLVSQIEGTKWTTLNYAGVFQTATVTSVTSVTQSVADMEKMLTIVDKKQNSYAASNIPLFGQIVFDPLEKGDKWHVTATLEFWVRDETKEIPPIDKQYSTIVTLKLTPTDPIGFIYPQLYCIGQKGIDEFKQKMEQHLQTLDKTWDDVNVSLACKTVSIESDNGIITKFFSTTTNYTMITFNFSKIYPSTMEMVQSDKIYGIHSTNDEWFKQSSYMENRSIQESNPISSPVQVLDSIPDTDDPFGGINHEMNSSRVNLVLPKETGALFRSNMFLDATSEFFAWDPPLYTYLGVLSPFLLKLTLPETPLTEEKEIPVTFTFAVKVEDKVVPDP